MNIVFYQVRKMQYREKCVKYGWAMKNQPRRKKILIRKGELIRGINKSDKETMICRLHKT